MRPTEILSAEHRVIEQVLDCLEEIVRKAARSRDIDHDSAGQTLRFLRTFADGCHHAKEERKLFPKLEARGMPREVGPVAVMLAEHELGREAVRRMEVLLQSARRGDEAACARFAKEATGYVTLLREHIGKEDHILFPMAEAMLSDQDREGLIQEFQHAEEHEVGSGVHAEMLAIADHLATKLGVPRAELRGAAPFTGCCHDASVGFGRCDRATR